MARKKTQSVSTLFHNTQNPEQIKVTRRRAFITTFKKREIMPIAQYVLDNEDSGKYFLELYEEFRKDCPHSFLELAVLQKDSRRITIQSCKNCFILVKGVGRPTDSNRLGNGYGSEE